MFNRVSQCITVEFNRSRGLLCRVYINSISASFQLSAKYNLAALWVQATSSYLWKNKIIVLFEEEIYLLWIMDSKSVKDLKLNTINRCSVQGITLLEFLQRVRTVLKDIS